MRMSVRPARGEMTQGNKLPAELESSLRGGNVVGARWHPLVMPRKMTPAQFRAAVQKAQRDQKRAINKYNSEVRKYNAGVTKAVNDYKRAVRNYNSKARAHNREVENQRRRLRQEVARLSSRPTTTFVQYRQSTATFVDSYERADASLAATPGSAPDRLFLDLVSDEAANSAYLANALEGDGDPASDFDGDDLRSPSLSAELQHFGDDLVQRWSGALFALSPPTRMLRDTSAPAHAK